MPGTFIDDGETEVNKTEKVPAHLGFKFYFRDTDNKPHI